MAYLTGGSLLQRMRAPATAKAVLRWTGELFSAVAYLHGKRILHSDMKVNPPFPACARLTTHPGCRL